MNLTLGVDVIPAYTETMKFLNSPPGQKVAEGIEDIAEDLIRGFHSHIQSTQSASTAPQIAPAGPTPEKSSS